MSVGVANRMTKKINVNVTQTVKRTTTAAMTLILSVYLEVCFTIVNQLSKPYIHFVVGIRFEV